MAMVLALGFGFVPGANAETIRVDVDGDKAREPVVASVPEPGKVRVASLLSAAGDAFTFLDLNGSGSAEPYIAAKGDVNKRKGAELFVRTGRYDKADTVAVLTVARRTLVNAGTFFVNDSLDDGLAMGIKCGLVGGEPGVRTYVFQLGKRGRWHRTVTPYVWKQGKYVKGGKEKKGKVALPSPTQTTIGCPKPPAPPEPPPVLGSAGNRFLSGLGTVEPKSFRAKQGAGRYFDFTWNGWGDARASARGYFTTGSGARKRRMNLTAFDLGQCGGREAYRKLTLKAKGQNGVTVNVC
jgi:hypothetical protein